MKLSLVDYPGQVAAAVFTIGCNFRCGYCHNPELVVPEQYTDELDEAEILKFLQSRVNKLDGVAISGGEPTLHKDLPEFIQKMKDMGLKIKLDSNGSNPDMLEKLFDRKLVDFVAMDVKGPLEKYKEIMSWEIDPAIMRRSVRLIIESGVKHEFRTTIVKSQLQPEDFHAVGKLVKGAERYALQHFRPNNCMVDTEKFKHESAYGEKDMERIRKIMLGYVKSCVIH